MERRVRPTFLLKLVALCLGVAMWFAVLLLVTSTGMRVGALIALLVAWVVGVELGLIAEVIERVIVKAHKRKDGPLQSIWVVDAAAEAEEMAEKERLRDSLGDNPTLR
jgi:FlaA1/EpsC-like NDP-sugar epimerase